MKSTTPSFLGLLLDSTPVGLALVDQELRFKYVNTTLATINGLSPADYISRTTGEVMSELAQQLTPHCQQVLSRKQAIIGLEVSGEAPSAPGEIRHWQGHCYPLVDQEEALLGVGVVLQDITEQKHTQQREHVHLQVLEMVAKCNPLAAILDAMVRGMETECPGMLGSILLLDEEGRHLLFGAGPSLPEAYSQAIHGAAIGPCAGSCGTAAFRGERVIVSDIDSDPLWIDYRTLVQPYGLKACWSQPILSSSGHVLGTFAMYYRVTRLPSEQDLGVISAAANIAGIAIDNDRARRELTTAYQQLESKENRLKKAMEAMEQAETKYRTLFESSSDAIVLFDGKIFLDCNNATLRIFGCSSRDQFIGTRPEAWVPAQHLSEEDLMHLAQAQFDEAFKHGSKRIESIYQRLNGTQFPAEIWLTRMEINGKAMIQATVRDITERKQAENALHNLNVELEERVKQRTRELTSANARLQELDQLKSLFMASMSHELRTPLNSIIGFTGIILQGLSGEINTEQRKQLGIVKNNAAHLLDLINDIIDVSKIESGAIELANEDFDLSALVKETSQALATAVTEKQLALSLQLPQVLIIHSDRRRLKQILINLIDNAIKFTDIGSVDIKLILYESQVMLSVRDSGIGIDTHHQSRLFQAFSQILPPSGQVHQGTGLGLYLSQRLAHLLGGEIKLTSAMGTGSCFTLILPSNRTQKP